MKFFKNPWVIGLLALAVLAFVEWKTRFFRAQYNQLMAKKAVAPGATLPPKK